MYVLGEALRVGTDLTEGAGIPEVEQRGPWVMRHCGSEGTSCVPSLEAHPCEVAGGVCL